MNIYETGCLRQCHQYVVNVFKEIVARTLESAIHAGAERLTSRIMFAHGLFIVAVKTMSILIVPILIVYFILIILIYYRNRRTLDKSLKCVLNSSSNGGAVAASGGADVTALLITAHPDDECMFFAPTIIRLVELNATVRLLCLSTGKVYK